MAWKHTSRSPQIQRSNVEVVSWSFIETKQEELLISLPNTHIGRYSREVGYNTMGESIRKLRCNLMAILDLGWWNIVVYSVNRFQNVLIY